MFNLFGKYLKWDTLKQNINTTENDLTIGNTINIDTTITTIESESKTNAQNLWKSLDNNTKQLYQVKLLLFSCTVCNEQHKFILKELCLFNRPMLQFLLLIQL